MKKILFILLISIFLSSCTNDTMDKKTQECIELDHKMEPIGGKIIYDYNFDKDNAMQYGKLLSTIIIKDGYYYFRSSKRMFHDKFDKAKKSKDKKNKKKYVMKF